MTEQIRTRWHKIVPLIEADEVYLTSAKNDTARHWSDFGGNKKLLMGLVNSLAKLPKFVIDEELLSLTEDNGFQLSLLDMQRADVLRLPFPAMTVEFDLKHGTRAIVLLRDNKSMERMPWEYPGDERNRLFFGKPFYGIALRIERDNQGEYLVLSPGILAIQIEDRDGIPWLGLTTQGHEILQHSLELNNLIGETFHKEGSVLWKALAGALLLMQTDGIKREVIECTRINKKRSASNKEPIPRHIVLSIGKVYRSDSSNVADDYIPHRSPRPHWRRGYNQPVRYGPRKNADAPQRIKLKYIEPKLVARKEIDLGTTSLLPQEYHIKR